MAMPKFGLPGVAGMLLGPAVKENSGSCHCSSHGLLAYGAGSSIVIVDVRSMQLVTVLPMPSPGTTAFQPAPFVTSVQWTPESLQRDLTEESPNTHWCLAVGDRQGRIAIWNVGTGEISSWLSLEGDRGRLGIQDMCWVYGQPWLLISIHGASLVVLWDTSTGQLISKIDASPEVLGCIKCDPLDSRQVCVVGWKGSVLSLYIGGMSESDVIVQRYQLNVIEERGNGSTLNASKGSAGSGDRDQGKDGGSVSTAGSAVIINQNPATLAGNNIRCLFSTTSRGLVYIMYPRELFVFDLQFGTVLSNGGLPRGCGKLLDLVAVVDGDILYCAHTDGRLTAWRRKRNQQAYSLCYMDVLLPASGTSVPAPAVLFVTDCSFQILVKNGGKSMQEHITYSMQLPSSPSLDIGAMVESPLGGDVSPFSSTSKDEEKGFLETRIVSVSDDGRLWHWSILSGCSCLQNGRQNPLNESSSFHKNEGSIEDGEAASQPTLSAKPDTNNATPIFKVMLTGQLSLLPSPITTLAVPVPSLLATTPGGGNGPAVSVPLVALATQAGTIELVDPMSNAITSSFLVHSSSVRGLRWLGNSRLVSFSYTEGLIKGKGGGFVNTLMVTCVRSGQSKPFRTLQKPERAPVRALRTSPSGRYLLILFREAPAEVWAMTKNPQMLRSLALPFTAMEWALPPAPKINTSKPASSSWRTSLFYKERPTIASTVAAANAPSVVPAQASEQGSRQNAENTQDEIAESFAFALINGSLGVFELRGRRVRDFRPKWPSASFVSADVLVTAMAYRMPHVVMGDRSGNIRWWDVSSGLSSTFNSHRGGVRRIKFAPVVVGDQTRGRVAVLFNDHTFAVYDLNAQDPLKSAIFQSPIGGGVLVLELDWFPLRQQENETLLLCIAGADSSFRLLEVNTSSGSKSGKGFKGATLERVRPMPLCSPALLPLPHALALRMLLQLGVDPSWFCKQLSHALHGSNDSMDVDLRSYMLKTSLPGLGEVVVAELLLKALEPYRKAGRLLDLERASTYGALASKSCTLRFAFAAAHFGDLAEAAFWLQLPQALSLLSKGSGGPAAFWDDVKTTPQKDTATASTIEREGMRMPARNRSGQLMESPDAALCPILQSQAELVLPAQWGLETVPNNQILMCAVARERIQWHDKLLGPEAIQKRVHELVSVGDLEAAVTLLLSTPPDSPNFYVDSLRAVSLASAVSPALHELAVKVVAANLVATENSLSGTHLLCAVGCYQEACTQLQDMGRWVDAATLAAAHLKGTNYSRVLQRWAEHVLQTEKNLWRAMILYVGAGALLDALAALRNAKQPDSAAMFLLACHEAKVLALSLRPEASSGGLQQAGPNGLNLPGGLSQREDETRAVCEFYGQYQIALAHLCTGVSPAVYL